MASLIWPTSNFRPERDIPDLTGQVVIVTGGNGGLGLETIRQLAKHGNPARIYLAARSEEKAAAAMDELLQSNPESCPISFLPLDLVSFASVKAAAKDFVKKESRLDILVNNAGIMMVDAGLTQDGYEIQFGTNVMGHALLTQLLLPVLEETAKTHHKETRVVNLTSAGEILGCWGIWNFDSIKTSMTSHHTAVRYGRSKLGNIQYSSALAERCKDKGVKVVSVHPGMVGTNLHVNADGRVLKTAMNIVFGYFATPVQRGAYSQIWAAVSPDAVNGEFHGPVGRQVVFSSWASRNKELGEKLWSWIQDELKDHL